MTRIPLPKAPGESFLQGVNTGSGMFQNIMHPILHRENQAMQQQQMQQDQQQHLRNAAIREQQEERLRQLLPYQQAEYEQKAKLNPYNLELLKSKINKENSLSEKYKKEPSSNYKPSELERIAMLLSEGDPDKQREILAEGAATKYGLTQPGDKNLPMGSTSFKSLPKNLQAQENADQIKMQVRVNDARKATHDLDEMEKIIKANPGMASELAYILGNPEDKSFTANLSRRYIDKKKLAAIEKFTKYSNDFVLSAGGGLGNNFTDAKLKALQLSKMHAGNTDESNRAIIGNYRSHLKPLINYGSELKKARGKYTLPYFEENYTDEARGIKRIEDLTDEELEALGNGS